MNIIYSCYTVVCIVCYLFAQSYRLYLDHLQSPDDAVRIVKEQSSIEGAKMVARYVYTSMDDDIMVNLSDFSKNWEMSQVL